jgi:hypothetical protein
MANDTARASPRREIRTPSQRPRAPRVQLAAHVGCRHLAYVATRADAIDHKETWS